MEQDELVLQSVAEEQEYTLTASHLLEYLFCPRFTYKTRNETKESNKFLC
jgi:hypothetical protein